MNIEEGKVSIIVPAFNVTNYITSFLKSIQAQTYSKWELIIVDDGSTDDTCLQIELYAKTDSRIRLLRRNREPKGSVTCRNIGQVASVGEYIIHFDADDIVEPFSLAQRINYMNEHPNVDYASFLGESIIEIGGEITRTGRYWGRPTLPDLLESFLRVQYPFSVWNNIYRASKFKNILWDENVKIYTDFSYIVPIIIEGFRHAFANTEKPDYLYRVGVKKAMTSCFISEEKYESTKYLFSKTLTMLAEMERGAYYTKCFKDFFLHYAQRVYHDGSREQIEDFTVFFLKSYKGDLNLRLSVIHRLLLKEKPNPKLVNGLFFLFYKPKLLIMHLFGSK